MKNRLKQGDALQPLLFSFVLEYTIRMVAVNQDCLTLNGTHQLFVYVDDVTIMRGSVRNTKKNKDALVVASKENGLEVNAAKTNNGSFESVEQFKYLGRTLTYQNSIQEEIKSRLKSGNACCHSV